MKKKITELTEVRWRTVHSFDDYGNRVRGHEEYVAKRGVKTIGAGPRAGHFLADTILFQIVVMFATFAFAMLNFISEDDRSTNLSTELIGNIVPTSICFL